MNPGPTDIAIFETTININIQRNSDKLEQVKSVTELNSISEHGCVLAYEYGQSNYAPIYFLLDATADGKFLLAQPLASTDPRAQNYGFLSSPNQFIDYLNSQICSKEPTD